GRRTRLRQGAGRPRPALRQGRGCAARPGGSPVLDPSRRRPGAGPGGDRGRNDAAEHEPAGRGHGREASRRVAPPRGLTVPRPSGRPLRAAALLAALLAPAPAAADLPRELAAPIWYAAQTGSPDDPRRAEGELAVAV